MNTYQTDWLRPLRDPEIFSGITDEGRKALMINAETFMRGVETPTDQEFLLFTEIGNRSVWEKKEYRWRYAMKELLLAECLGQQGRFIPGLNRLFDYYMGIKTWVMNAHDRELHNFSGRHTSIDLGSAMLALNLAVTIRLMGDQLDPDKVAGIKERIAKDVWDAYEDQLAGGEGAGFWHQSTNNWNAVCHCGVVGSALTLMEDQNRLREFILGAHRHLQSFIDGFTDDGNCSEGVGYWNYGVMHYVSLCEMLYRASDGAVNWYKEERSAKVYEYGFKISMRDNLAPAFADCELTALPNRMLMALIALRTGRQAVLPPPAGIDGGEKLLYWHLIGLMNLQAIEKQPCASLPLRDRFEEAGVSIFRPGGPGRLSFAIKGGHNGEHHNHNDLGSYVIGVDDVPVIPDAGQSVYTANTFSPRRYENPLLNSFGHAVPVIDGQLQGAGADYRATLKILISHEDRERVDIDLSKAYPLSENISLHRNAQYLRQSSTGGEKIIIKDHFDFDRPMRFENAMISLSENIRNPEPGSFQIEEQGKRVNVQFEASAPVQFTWSILEAEAKHGRPVHRLAIRFVSPLSSGWLEMTVSLL